MFPKIQQYDTPKTRAEFELRFHYLRESLKNGNMSIPSDLGESLLRLRLLPNGRLDFLSVDEMARLQANMTLHLKGMQNAFRDRED